MINLEAIEASLRTAPSVGARGARLAVMNFLDRSSHPHSSRAHDFYGRKVVQTTSGGTILADKDALCPLAWGANEAIYISPLMVSSYYRDAFNLVLQALEVEMMGSRVTIGGVMSDMRYRVLWIKLSAIGCSCAYSIEGSSRKIWSCLEYEGFDRAAFPDWAS